MDITAALYLHAPTTIQNPSWPDRDRIICQPAQGPSLYLGLAFAAFVP